MATGLLALLDDVAALVKVTAATLDDIPAHVAKTSSKVSGVVIDDAAVTPKYVVGLDPKRELAIIYKIAKSSLFNKLIYLAPAALLLGYLAPWVIQPILMVGGAYLCFEGYEKVHTIFAGHGQEEAENDDIEQISPDDLEKMRVAGAVRTDFILSAEIVAIAYSMVANQPVVTQILVLLSVAILITVGVYGFVALVVKADDLGIYLARRYKGFIGFIGRAIVRIMPGFLKTLGFVGTAAMLWVGAEIIAHGIPFLEHGLGTVQSTFAFNGAIAWLAKALTAAVGGLILGWLIAIPVSMYHRHARGGGHKAAH